MITGWHGDVFYGSDGRAIGCVREVAGKWMARFDGRGEYEERFLAEQDARDYIEFKRDFAVTIRLGDISIDELIRKLDRAALNTIEVVNTVTGEVAWQL